MARGQVGRISVGRRTCRGSSGGSWPTAPLYRWLSSMAAMQPSTSLPFGQEAPAPRPPERDLAQHVEGERDRVDAEVEQRAAGELRLRHPRHVRDRLAVARVQRHHVADRT